MRAGTGYLFSHAGKFTRPREQAKSKSDVANGTKMTGGFGRTMEWALIEVREQLFGRLHVGTWRCHCEGTGIGLATVQA